ncbi:putative ATPase/DNA-binding CsgD family transcriptional regulator [Streptomyces sp. SAI-135]|nr:putative ATPase/DNA-binding CsgD family transcriptional regulator [Streptomyces sp. SAI-090]MDH6573733.1 putative ATPase/DNA-binding CsgD family transcriptional regulator [Streptomyces sp. SAI-117]MDH6613539.1 putative ATPase/DNA-binding CsgD family transcriptional regulator [Streptomyces sp. SAI-135]
MPTYGLPRYDRLMGRSAHRTDGDSLPAEVTTFVGRRHELGEARKLLSTSRLVTLTGPGGVGKTRLAMRIGDQARRAFPDGVVLVELAEVRSAELVPHAVALALGFRDEPSGWSAENLAERLAHKHLLLVLDNCEHVIVACALLIRRILTRAPEVHVLTTSREAMKIGGEYTYAVPPLPVPTWNVDSRAADLAQYDGVRLFLDRAQARAPGFVMTERNAPHVAQICRRLDGIPLAIELAADRVRALPVEQINARLSSRLRLLTTGDRSASARHQTLLASITWSYDLCSQLEQLMWARLSVFPSSFVVSAVESVCTGDALAADDVVDLLTELVEKSILTREEDAGPEARYRMLGTLREFGHERLVESGGSSSVQERLVVWSAGLARRYREGWFGPGQQEWSSRLRTEHQNVASALGFALDARDPAQAMSIASDLNLYWVTAGLLSEGRHWLRRGVEESEPGTPGRATAMRWLAYFSFYLGDADLVPQLVADAMSELGPEPAPGDLAYLRFVEGMAQLAESDPHGAQAPLDQALRLFASTDDDVGKAHVLLGYGLTQWLCGDLASAKALLQECMRLTGQHVESTLHSSALMNLGMVVWDAGEPAAAEAMVLEALQLKVHDEELIGQAMCLDALAWFSVSQDPQRAATLAGCAETAWRRSGASIETVSALSKFRDASLEQLRAKFPDRVLASLMASGAELSSAQALAYATGMQERGTGSGDHAEVFRPLTNREWQVAQQIADGLGNRQIAGRLAISPRTVDAHVAHILEKLAFSSRAQVAAWVAERQREPRG